LAISRREEFFPNFITSGLVGRTWIRGHSSPPSPWLGVRFFCVTAFPPPAPLPLPLLLLLHSNVVSVLAFDGSTGVLAQAGHGRLHKLQRLDLRSPMVHRSQFVSRLRLAHGESKQQKLRGQMQPQCGFSSTEGRHGKSSNDDRSQQQHLRRQRWLQVLWLIHRSLPLNGS